MWEMKEMREKLRRIQEVDPALDQPLRVLLIDLEVV